MVRFPLLWAELRLRGGTRSTLKNMASLVMGSAAWRGWLSIATKLGKIRGLPDADVHMRQDQFPAGSPPGEPTGGAVQRAGDSGEVLHEELRGAAPALGIV